MPSISPLAPAAFPEVRPVAGVALAGVRAGLKKRDGAKDLLLARFAAGTTAAGVLTRSLCPSAPVEWCREILPRGRARALVVNSGNSNAFTGAAGRAALAETVKAAAQLLGCARHEVYVASTGVIGAPLPAKTIPASLPQAAAALRSDAWRDAADAITTTDTFPKASSRVVDIRGVKVTISGIAKGSGMIAPDLGTMLAFVFTDAKISAPFLRTMLAQAAATTFNCISVDGDTSTSDTLLLFATGQARHAPIARGSIVARDFQRALEAVCVDLAQQVVRDGEGAQKFVTIHVTGASSPPAARKIARAIADSPLVKTAIAGADANWGRIVMAVGKAGQRAERDRLRISIGGVCIAEKGEARPGYDETPVAAHMKGRDIVIEVDVGVGGSRATVWTCDLTHGYIDINASYRS